MYSACGVCEYCNSGKETYCAQIKGSAFDVDGAMAEECIVKADYSVKVPEGLDSAVASSITCAGVTTYKAIKVSKVRPGQWIAIYGLGGLGNLALQYAKNVYNARVIAIDINEGQLKFAKEMGAEITINPKNEDPAKVIQDKVGGAHAAVVTAVATQAYESAVRSLRRLGKLVGVGVPNDDVKISIPELLPMGITITTSVVGTRTDLAEAFEFAKKGIVKPKVTMRRMDEVNEIFDEMEKGKFQGRMVVDLKKK